MRAASFAFVAVLCFTYWLVADPSTEVTAKQFEWPYVLWFSAMLLALGVAYPLFARLVGGRLAFRVSLVPAAGAALSSLVNVVEDGFGVDGAFIFFAVATGIGLLGLIALTIVVAYSGRGGYRLLALVPAATVLGIIGFVPAGGPILGATWLGAAALAIALPSPAAAEPAPASS